jgi:hypothetical protein
MSFTATASITLAKSTVLPNESQSVLVTVNNTGTDAISVLSVGLRLTSPTRPCFISEANLGSSAFGCPLPTGTDNELPTALKTQDKLSAPFTPVALIAPVASPSLVVTPGGGLVSGGAAIASGQSATFQFTMVVGGLQGDSLTVTAPVTVLDTVTGVDKLVLPTPVALTVNSLISSLGL